MTGPAVLVVLGVVVVAGAFVQSSIGFGMAVVSAPFVVVLAPHLMPGSLLVASSTLPVVQLLGSERDVDRPLLTWALVARLLTMPLGVWAVATLSPQAISVVVGVLILVTVAGSVTRLDIQPTGPNAFVAGALAGVSGTAASIGGPFLALVLQHERPTRIRATLAGFFLVGSGMAVVGLAVGGQFSAEQLRAGLLWVPGLLVGHVLAVAVRGRIDQRRMRAGVLAFCVLAGLSVIVRAVV